MRSLPPAAPLRCASPHALSDPVHDLPGPTGVVVVGLTALAALLTYAVLLLNVLAGVLQS